FYPALGAGIWVTILAVLGYSLGHNEDAIRDNLHLITLITLGAVAVIVLLYVRLKLKKKVLR
ncbi:MAG: DedA family protein, partial [Thiobacillus sp.]|nr:DedA family protein [Thiobacillus sp.]